MLLHRGEAEVLAAEEEQSVEEDDGGVRPQLLTVPQKLLLHTGMNVTCRGDEGRGVNPLTRGRVCVKQKLTGRQTETLAEIKVQKKCV